MGIESDYQLAAGVLVVFDILFFTVLKRLSKAYNRMHARTERKVNDVAVYLSHVNEDKAHLEKSSGNKIDRQWAETHFSAAFSDMRASKAEKAKVRLVISRK
ncbi:MAG: hypothetical protein ABH863_01270 [Candidatus Micrarchaeota archaeon]